MKKILITGGTGFIGYHLAGRLALENGNEITLTSRPGSEMPDKDLRTLLAKPNVKVIEIDLTDRKSWNKMATGYDNVYHLAGLKSFKDFATIPHEVMRIGLESTLNLLNWFKSESNKPGAKILFTSSSEAYAGIPDTYEPRWSYAAQKLICEMLLINYAKAYNLRMVILRPNNVYGPRSGHDTMIPKMISRIEQHIDPFPVINPKELRTSLYVDDLVGAMILAIGSSKTDGKTYYVAGNEETTVKKLLEDLFRIKSWHPKNFKITDSPKDLLPYSLPADTNELKQATSWQPKTTLEEGLRKTAEWYKSNQRANQ